MRRHADLLTKWPGSSSTSCESRLVGELAADERLETQAALRVRDGREQQPRVGVLRVEQHRVGRALLDDPPAVHHEHLVGDVARARDVVRDVQEGDSDSRLSCRIRLRMPMRIDTSSIEIGSSPRITLGSTASARAIATRWRCPPESWWGYFCAISPGGTSPTRCEQLVHALVDLAARADAVDLQRPRDVVVDALDRVQRRERILEDHLHLRAVREQRLAPPRSLTSSPSNRIVPGSAGTAARACARRCSCRCRSRRRAPSRSPGRSVNETS